MFFVKKYHFIFILCFLTTFISFRFLAAEEVLKKNPPTQQKTSKKQENAPSFVIKGTKIEIVPNERAADQQKADSKQKLTSPDDQPQISLDSTSHNVGEVWEGEDIIHTFTVKNTGRGELKIKSVKAG